MIFDTPRASSYVYNALPQNNSEIRCLRIPPPSALGLNLRACHFKRESPPPPLVPFSSAEKGRQVDATEGDNAKYSLNKHVRIREQRISHRVSPRGTC